MSGVGLTSRHLCCVLLISLQAEVRVLRSEDDRDLYKRLGIIFRYVAPKQQIHFQSKTIEEATILSCSQMAVSFVNVAFSLILITKSGQSQCQMTTEDSVPNLLPFSFKWIQFFVFTGTNS